MLDIINRGIHIFSLLENDNTNPEMPEQEPKHLSESITQHLIVVVSLFRTYSNRLRLLFSTEIQ